MEINTKKDAITQLKKGISFRLEIFEKFREDQDVCFNAILSDDVNLKYIPKKLFYDINFTLRLMNISRRVYAYLPNDLKKNDLIFKVLIKEIPSMIAEASEELKDDKELIKEIIKDNPLKVFPFISNRLKCDKDIALNAIKIDGTMLRYCSEELKNNKEMAKTAIKNNPFCIKIISNNLQNDKDFILDLLINDNINPCIIIHISEELKNNYEIIKTGILNSKKSDQLIEVASNYLKNNKEIVNLAIDKNGLSLEFISEELKNDKDIVLKAIRNNGLSLEFSSEKLKNDKDIVLEAVKQNGNALKFASKELKNDKLILKEAINNNKIAFIYASKELKLLCNKLNNDPIEAINKLINIENNQKVINEKINYNLEKNKKIKI